MSGVALVTGASRGIGRAIAIALGSDGHAIAVNFASRADAAEDVVSEIRAAAGKPKLSRRMSPMPVRSRISSPG